MSGGENVDDKENEWLTKISNSYMAAPMNLTQPIWYKNNIKSNCV